MKLKQSLYLQEINIANLLLVLALKIRFRVITWKILLPDFLKCLFTRLKPYEFIDRDEWLIMHDNAFSSWKNHVLPYISKHYSAKARHNGIEVDYSKNLWQAYGDRFGKFYLFLEIVNKHRVTTNENDFSVIVPWIGWKIKNVLTDTQPKTLASLKWSRVFLVTDIIHEWIITMAQVGLSLKSLGLGWFVKKTGLANIEYLWTGIGRQEIPRKDDQLNFAWAKQYGYIKNGDILYVLVDLPNDEQDKYLKSNKIKYVVQSKMISLLPFERRIVVALAIVRTLFLSIVLTANIENIFILRFVSRAAFWLELVRHLKPKYYFTSTSYAWPEKPELAVMHALDVKTIIWAYSANTMKFTSSEPAFKDLRIERSIVIADEFWVWHEAVRNLLESRQVPINARTASFVVKGAMMCGNPAHLQKDPPAARSYIGLPENGFFLSVFDVPSVNKLWQQNFSNEPMPITIELSEKFFRGLLTLLKCIPNLSLILKLKRSVTDPFREYPPSLHKILSYETQEYGRVYNLDVNIDPYLPIAAGNGAIGIPYTSPVLAAIASSRYGIYYDPIGRARYPVYRKIRDITVESEEELINVVRGWIDGTVQGLSEGMDKLLPRIASNPF